MTSPSSTTSSGSSRPSATGMHRSFAPAGVRRAQTHAKLDDDERVGHRPRINLGAGEVQTDRRDVHAIGEPIAPNDGVGGVRRRDDDVRGEHAASRSTGMTGRPRTSASSAAATAALPRYGPEMRTSPNSRDAGDGERVERACTPVPMIVSTPASARARCSTETAEPAAVRAAVIDAASINAVSTPVCGSAATITAGGCRADRRRSAGTRRRSSSSARRSAGTYAGITAMKRRARRRGRRSAEASRPFRRSPPPSPLDRPAQVVEVEDRLDVASGEDQHRVRPMTAGVRPSR